MVCMAERPNTRQNWSGRLHAEMQSKALPVKSITWQTHLDQELRDVPPLVSLKLDDLQAKNPAIA